MGLPLRVLIVEDSEDDERLLLRHLRQSGFQPASERVDNADAMRAALDRQAWDLVISDYVMPQFSGAAALALMKDRGLDLPFIVVSGTISEEIAVAAMRAGAHDYVFKGNLTRLTPAIERELREAEVRRNERRSRLAEQERNELRAAMAAQEKALSVVSHELRTPLAAARAMAEMLLTDIARGTNEYGEYLNGVHDEVVRMSQMVNDLLEVARLNSGAAKWNWSDLSVQQTCFSALASIRPLIDAQKVALSLHVAPEEVSMKGDAAGVRRLVLNLLSNAAKFTPAGTISVTARAITDTDGDWLEIKVADSGEGMAAETAAKLGEPFALNSGLVGESVTSGTGLGFMICKGIAAAHGGMIGVASVVGRGTTVTVLLRSDLATPVAEPIAHHLSRV